MAEDEQPKKEPHLRPFKPKPLPPPEPGAMASDEHRRLLRDGQEPLPSVRSLMNEANAEAQARAKLPLDYLGALLNGEDEPYDWLIPGIIEREDRVIVTGDEGYGKSTLLRQIALSACIGENTLTDQPINTHSPIRVLYIDLENPRRHVVREIRKLRALLEAHTETMRFALHLDTAGMVLDDPRDRDKDRALVTALLDAHKPDLLIIGPLYKMMGGDPTEERDARELARFLDLIRGRYHCALIIEAHAPHNQIRPYGWSGWKRWPERGIHLNNEGQLTNWRGTRGDSVWPSALKRAVPREVPQWPWVPRITEPPSPHDGHSERMAELELEVLRIVREVGRPLTRNEIDGRTEKRRKAVLAAITRCADRGSLVPVALQIKNAQGAWRTVTHYGVNAEREPDVSGSVYPSAPIDPETAEPLNVVELFPDSEDDEP